MTRGSSIRRRIVVSFAFILGLTIAIAVLADARLSRIDAEANAVQSRSLPALELATAIDATWSDVFALAEEAQLVQDAPTRQRLAARGRESLAQLKPLMCSYDGAAATPAARQAFDDFRTAVNEFVRVQDEAAGTDAQGSSWQTSSVNARLTSAFESGSSAIRSVIALNRKDADASVKQISADVGTTKIAVLSGMIAVFVLAGACGVGLLRVTRDLAGLVGQVQQSGLQVNTSVTEIAATAKEQQATANEIAATTTEIGATSR